MSQAACHPHVLGHLVAQTKDFIGKKRPNWRLTDAQKKALCRDILAGLPQQEIMDRCGVAHVTVIKYRKRLKASGQLA